MNLMMKVLVACCLLQANVVFAESSKTINYANQKVEEFNLESYLKEIKMIDQEVKATCQRKVPYEENVCKDVTKYKKECATVPAHEECKQVNNPICHTETHMENECYNLPSTQECRQVPTQVCNNQTTYENECRNVTERVCHDETRYEQQCRTVPGEQQCRVVVRYRNECSTEGGGQQCRTIPGDVQCSVVNGENRCVKIPPRQECTTEPSRQVCRQVPYEERECSQGPSRQECTNVPRTEQVCQNVSRQQCEQVPHTQQVCHTEYKQQCTTVPGDEVCHDVPRDREVCVDNYSTKCENVPAKEVCKNVPYKEQVCKMETKYKNEDYECTKTIKVPQEKLLKTHKADVKVEFNVLSEILGPEFNFELDENGKLAITAEANNDEYYGNSKAVVFVKKDVKSTDAGEVNNIAANLKVTMLNAKENLAYLNTNDIYGTLKKYSLVFKLEGKVDPKRATLGLKIMRKEIVEIDKAAISKSNISYEYKDGWTTITVDLKGEGAKVGSILTSEKTQYDTTITYAQNYSDAGDLILGRAANLTWKMNRTLYIAK